MNQSALDYYSGQQAAGFAWQRFSGRLQDRLSQAEMDFANAESGRIGFAHLFKAMAEELRRVDPTNPLLQKETQLRLLGAKISEKATEMGYVYDQQRGRVVGKR